MANSILQDSHNARQYLARQLRAVRHAVDASGDVLDTEAALEDCQIPDEDRPIIRLLIAAGAFDIEAFISEELSP